MTFRKQFKLNFDFSFPFPVKREKQTSSTEKTKWKTGRNKIIEFELVDGLRFDIGTLPQFADPAIVSSFTRHGIGQLRQTVSQ